MLCQALIAALLLGAAPIHGAQQNPGVPRDLHQVHLLPGRGEARVHFTPRDGKPASEKVFTSSDDDRTFRIEPGNTYLFPASLWDRFAGSRRGPFRIVVTTRVSEIVLASGHQVAREPADEDGFILTTFEGNDAERGMGLYVLALHPTPEGALPPGPPWAEEFLEPVLVSLENRFGPLPGPRPEIVVVDFPGPVAKSFPGALVLDRRLAQRDGPPPAGRLAVLAHEAAHLWWANGVRAGGPGAAALQEGLAEFGACRVIGDILGPIAEAARWAALRDEYLLSSEAIADAGASLLTDRGEFGRALRYARSSWVIRMLESRVGESHFRQALESLQTRGKVAGWDDLVAAMTEAAVMDLTDFHTGWIAGTGHPDPVIAPETLTLVSVLNQGRGSGEFPVVTSCGDQPEVRTFLHIPPGESVKLAQNSGCEPQVDPGGVFLTGAPGPAALPGLTLGRAWGYPVVRVVRPGSAAARARLEPGDLLVKADGRPLDEGDVADLMQLLSTRKEVRLWLRRGQEERETVFRRIEP